MILSNILFDVNGNFQWASVAAIISFLTFCSTLVSLIFTHKQAKQNRKSTTLVKLRLEELKELKELAVTSISLIDSFIHDKNAGVRGNKPMSNSDPIISELNTNFIKLQSILHRRTEHGSELSIAISTCQLKLMMLEDTMGLTDIGIILDQAIEDYWVKEWNEIEKKI
ncbi:hypothetical protein [Rummeliibacillus suwonensis]|uniref:hypothetical protein n=1 Tax=Rummeliibacillus suwonensis TaxID=1306154 RepID=UPI0028A0B0F8|nr:hypothetical protein [Rummeliibacillus suwonensis]